MFHCTRSPCVFTRCSEYTARPRLSPRPVGVLLTQVHDLDSPNDYRMLKHLARAGRTYMTPLGSDTDEAMDEFFGLLTKGRGTKPLTLQLRGRKLKVERAARKVDVARFGFDELCGKPLGAEVGQTDRQTGRQTGRQADRQTHGRQAGRQTNAAQTDRRSHDCPFPHLRPYPCQDYLGLASAFHTIFVESVPQLSFNDINRVRRFITLIDSLYEKRVRRIIPVWPQPAAAVATAPKPLSPPPPSPPLPSPPSPSPPPPSPTPPSPPPPSPPSLLPPLSARSGSSSRPRRPWRRCTPSMRRTRTSLLPSTGLAPSLRHNTARVAAAEPASGPVGPSRASTR